MKPKYLPIVSQDISKSNVDSTPYGEDVDAPKPIPKVVQVFVGISMFMLAGPCLVVVNRNILKDSEFRYPVTLSGMGVVSTGTITRLLVYLGVLKMERTKVPANKLLAVCCCTAISMSSGNAAYMYLTVSFIQMLKSGTPVIIMAISSISGVDKVTFRVGLCISWMAVSSMVTSLGEINLNWLGIAAMIISECAEGMRVVLTGFLLSKEKFTVVETLYYLQPIMAMWFLAIALINGEIYNITQTGAWSVIFEIPGQFLAMFVLAYAVNWSSYLVIKTTSGMMSKLLVTVRNIGLVLFAWMFYADQITLLQAAGYVSTLAGFVAYSYYRIIES